MTEVILRGIPYRHNKYKIHPATRTFQALRIRVNDEVGSISQALREICRRIPVIFPAHPRTKKNIERFAFQNHFADERIRFIEPLGYLDFMKLMMNARFMMTDSGGIQEETTVLNIPCLTLRNTTERPITLTHGTNTLVWNDPQKIASEAFKIIDGKGKKGSVPALWDGKAAVRIVGVIAGLETRQCPRP